MPFEPGQIPEGAKPWKEGDPSPNPSGRPKGSRNLSTILKAMLEEEIDVIVDGAKEKKQFQEVIIRKLLKKAHEGNIKAITEIFDRTEGKPRQIIQANLVPSKKDINDLFPFDNEETEDKENKSEPEIPS